MVSTEAVGDGLSVFDHEQMQSYVLNATSALVFQHCDGQTTPQQLTELLRRKLNVPPAEAGKLMRLALDELETAGRRTICSSSGTLDERDFQDLLASEALFAHKFHQERSRWHLDLIDEHVHRSPGG